MVRHPPRPRDPNQLAKLIVDMSRGEVPNDSPKEPDSPAIQARRKGGKARAKSLSSRKRKAIARKAARARWNVRPPKAVPGT